MYVENPSEMFYYNVHRRFKNKSYFYYPLLRSQNVPKFNEN